MRWPLVNDQSTRLQPVPGIGAVHPYAPPAFPRPIELKLDGNEGLLPDPHVFDALARIGSTVLQRYPNARPLEESLARQWRIEPDQVIVTAGADEALDRVCRAILAPGRQIIVPTPTFEMLPRYARLAGAEIVSVPWSDGAFPTPAVLEQDRRSHRGHRGRQPQQPDRLRGVVNGPSDRCCRRAKCAHHCRTLPTATLPMRT